MFACFCPTIERQTTKGAPKDGDEDEADVADVLGTRVGAEEFDHEMRERRQLADDHRSGQKAKDPTDDGADLRVAGIVDLALEPDPLAEPDLVALSLVQIQISQNLPEPRHSPLTLLSHHTRKLMAACHTQATPLRDGPKSPRAALRLPGTGHM